MSGHSHWSTIKRKKQSEDAKRGKIFSKLSRSIYLAVREGGGVADPDSNPGLRFAINQAQGENMPKEKILGAIEKGLGKGELGSVDRLSYGVFIFKDAVLRIEAVSDNKNRTTTEIRNIIEKFGGSLTTAEAADPYFDAVGVLKIDLLDRVEDEILDIIIDSGALNYKIKRNYVELYCAPSKTGKTVAYLKKSGEGVVRSTIKYRPKNIMEDPGREIKKMLNDLISLLKDREDVVSVFVNF